MEKPKINWEMFHAISVKLQHSLVKGEEATLTEDEINEINESLEIMNTHANYTQIQFNKARKKFGVFPERTF